MSQTGLTQAGGIYNEARLTTDLTIYRFLSAAEKTLFFFLPTKPTRNPLKKRSDHSFYHRQTRNTRKQWTKKARGASVLERKRHESTQSAREDRPTSVGVVEAARSSRVTQTISSVHNRPYGFGMDTRLFFCLKYCFCYCRAGSPHGFFSWIRWHLLSFDPTQKPFYTVFDSTTLIYAVCSPFTYRIATPCLVSIRTGVFCTYGTSITPTKR